MLTVPVTKSQAEVKVDYEYRDDEVSEPEAAPEPRGPYARLKIGEPVSVAKLADVSRVRITGDFTGSNYLGAANLMVLDRDGKTVTFDEYNQAGHWVALHTVLNRKVALADMVEVK